MKTSKIFTLHKGGDELEPKQYRPVSLLPIGSRLLEKIVCDQITEYLRSEGLFHCQNHGYRCNHGTITAVLEAYQEAQDALEEGRMAGAVLLDQSAAFDVVSHTILKEKLKQYAFDEKAQSWYMNYLSERIQYVAIESSVSTKIKTGPYSCPQGSCLGPLTWTLFTGELPEVISSEKKEARDVVEEVGGHDEIKNKRRFGKIIQYADDVIYMIVANCLREIKRKVHED